MFSAEKKLRRGILLCAATASLSVIGTLPLPGRPLPQQQTSTVVRALGTVKTISGNDITLTPDKGAEVSIQVQSGARILRIEPGQTDLKNAAAITLADIQPGDRILAAGRRSDDGTKVLVTQLVAMKHTAVQAIQQQERDAWQRGVGGLVSAVDPAAATITIKVASLAGTKDLAVHTTPQTDFRRYAPDSVNFDDAKTSALDQIKPGDQLRARGTRSTDGNSFAADAIVTGSFRNVDGTISSIDAAAKTIRLTDLATKQPVVVHFTAQSEVRKLPAQMAQFIAVRMKGTSADAGPGGQSQADSAGRRQGMRRGGGGAGFGGAGAPGGQGGGPRGARGAGGDLQQMLARAPVASLSDFQKGDAVMIVSTQGAVSDELTAITMLGGVEPILEATPKGGQPMQLSPWSLGGGGGEAGGDAGGGDAGGGGGGK